MLCFGARAAHACARAPDPSSPQDYDNCAGDVLNAIAATAQDGDGDAEDRPERVYWWEQCALRFRERQWRRELCVSKRLARRWPDVPEGCDAGRDVVRVRVGRAARVISHFILIFAHAPGMRRDGGDGREDRLRVGGGVGAQGRGARRPQAAARHPVVGVGTIAIVVAVTIAVVIIAVVVVAIVAIVAVVVAVVAVVVVNSVVVVAVVVVVLASLSSLQYPSPVPPP